jgi:glucokinase
MNSPTLTCAGVDLGGTKISIVLGCSDGRILASGRLDTQPEVGPAGAFERTAQLIDRLSAQQEIVVSAIGVGVPGLVDADKGIIEFLPNLPQQWSGFPACRFLHGRTGKPAFMLNDARLAALGEHSFDSGLRADDMLVVTVGPGIGGGLILDGRLRLGVCGAAGEIGHHTILPDGPPCSCGSRGCLETLVSGPALSAEGAALARSGAAPRLAAMVDGNWAAITPKEMAMAAKQGDEAVAKAIERAAQYLGIGIANAVSITAVQQVVICGGVAALGELLLQPIRAVVRERVRMFPAERVRIACSGLGDRTGALGALALALQHASNPGCALGKGDRHV